MGYEMRNIILLSGLDKTKYFPLEIVNEIKANVYKPVNMAVLTADFNNYEKNDRHFYGNEETIGVFNTFRKIFPNLNIVLLDSRTEQNKGVEILRNADIIYLFGGNPFTQLEYLKKYNYTDIFQNTDALIIGISAGSMNLAINSYYSKDEDYPESVIYEGLGLTDITIDPHFDIDNEDQVSEIMSFSKKIKIIGLPNESAIIISNGNVKYIGDIYIYENGELKK